MDMDHKRIIITGATGFIGSNLARLFLQKGTEVVVLVRPGSVHMEALPSHERLRIIPCALEDVLDYVKEHKEEIGPAEGFFHLAWGGVNREEIDSPKVQARNVAASLDCVRAAHLLQCSVFMDAGSRVEYGAVEGQMKEELECHPINQYGKAKLEFYQKAVPLCKTLGMAYCHLRFFSVYGYGDHPWSIISTLVRELRRDHTVSLSACLHQWNFMYIEDAVQAVYELYQRFIGENVWGPEGKPEDGMIVNLAGRDTRTLRSFVEEIHEIVGKKGSLEYGTFKQGKEGALSVCPDIARLEALTGGWHEKYSFRQGILEMIEREEQSAALGPDGYENIQKEAERI